MGAWTIIRDETSRVVAAMSKLVHHVDDPLAAEAVALWRAIVFCREVGAFQVEFEADFLGVVQAVNNGNAGWSSYEHLMDDIRTTLVEFPNSIVRHAKRSANRAAHGLAQLAMHQLEDCVWNRCCPNSIRDIVVAEQSFSA
jgi:hypothetical protein